MAVRITSRDAFSWLALLGYIWLIAFSSLVAFTGGSAAVTVVAAITVVVALGAGLVIAEDLWRSGKAPVWLPAVGAVLGIVSGLVAVASGQAANGILLGVPSVAVVAWLVARDPEAWRALASRPRGTAGQPQPAPGPAPTAPKPVRLTPSDRAARFIAEVFALDAAQLETMIDAWNGLERRARDVAWDAARPYLTAPDRKELLTEVREELKRWSAGEAHGEGAPSQEIDTALRRRAGRALLDAAAGVIAQDRMNKHDFDVLYAPFRSAITGEPLKIARRPKGSADVGVPTRVRRKAADGAGELSAEPADETEGGLDGPEAIAGREPAPAR